MTRDDIIRMAKEVSQNFAHRNYEGDLAEFFNMAYAAGAAAEREAIEDIILDYADRDDLSDSDESLLKHLLDLIRARGE